MLSQKKLRRQNHIRSYPWALKLQDINQDIGAWLLSEDTLIDYPVLQADDNRCYLNHLYTGEINGAGSLFQDYRNTGLLLTATRLFTVII